MDPHSRFSPFNSRQPKAGPMPASTRLMDSTLRTTNPLEAFKKRPASRRNSSASSSAVLPAGRPIATNSRIKQDEQYRKDMYLAFINNALQQKSKGISDAFDELVDQFNPRQNDATSASAQPRLWIIALSHVVSRLERVHSALIEAVISMPWTTMDTTFVKSYTSFVGMLISAKPEYLNLVLGKISSGFTYQSGLQALDAGLPETSSRPLTRRVVYDRLHYLLEHLLSLVPTLPSTLQPLLVRSFPHKRQSQAAQVTYIRNLLRITEYCPELTDRIMATIIDRAIQIDVEIQVELEELEEHASEEQPELFDFDPFDTVVGQEGESDSGSDDGSDGEDNDDFSDLSSDAEGEDDSEKAPAEEPTNMQHVQDMVNKLDAILKNIFDYFKHSHTISEQPSPHLPTPSSPNLSDSRSSTPLTTHPTILPENSEAAMALRRTQFYTLLSIFDRTILRTFKSRYTQFVVFWFSSLDPEFSDLFQGMLVSKALLEEDQPSVTRAAAASYIASFVSRAVFVDKDSARQVVVCLCNFLNNRLDILDAVTQSGANPPSMAHHTVFYAVTQAVFLIFCFRWRDLMHEQEDVDELAGAAEQGKWMNELAVLKRAVQSELNPLKVCASNVVMQFARVAHATDFLYCYSIIEANRRSEYSSTSQPHANVKRMINPIVLGDAVHAELNTFFPFDPYKLPRSGAYIESVYREWASVAIDDDEDDEDDDDDEDEGEEVQPTLVDDGLEWVPRNDVPAKADAADGLGASFGGMSISPAHPAISLISMSVGSAMSMS